MMKKDEEKSNCIKNFSFDSTILVVLGGIHLSLKLSVSFGSLIGFQWKFNLPLKLCRTYAQSTAVAKCRKRYCLW